MIYTFTQGEYSDLSTFCCLEIDLSVDTIEQLWKEFRKNPEALRNQQEARCDLEYQFTHFLQEKHGAVPVKTWKEIRLYQD